MVTYYIFMDYVSYTHLWHIGDAVVCSTQIISKAHLLALDWGVSWAQNTLVPTRCPLGAHKNLHSNYLIPSFLTARVCTRGMHVLLEQQSAQALTRAVGIGSFYCYILHKYCHLTILSMFSKCLHAWHRFAHFSPVDSPRPPIRAVVTKDLAVDRGARNTSLDWVIGKPRREYTVSNHRGIASDIINEKTEGVNKIQ